MRNLLIAILVYSSLSIWAQFPTYLTGTFISPRYILYETDSLNISNDEINRSVPEYYQANYLFQFDSLNLELGLGKAWLYLDELDYLMRYEFNGLFYKDTVTTYGIKCNAIGMVSAESDADYAILLYFIQNTDLLYCVSMQGYYPDGSFKMFDYIDVKPL